ncbi:MAG: choice-of-anchor tandem repeat GloVer-containing protein [Candidatus Sulfotelmatobacter sp.]
MTRNKPSTAVIKALVAVTVMLIVTLVLASGAAAASTYKILHYFQNPASGESPNGPLIFDAAGNLYGTTFYGSDLSCNPPGGCGVVFKLTPASSGWSYTVLHTFTGPDGGTPFAGLIFDAAGSLYGTTVDGGIGTAACPGGCGVVFKLTPNADGSWTESVLHIFVGSDGDHPFSLIFDAAGNLYGMTSTGVVFKLAPHPDGTWTESILYTLAGVTETYPPTGLILDAAGNLYGTTLFGGAGGEGVVFKLTPHPDGSWTRACCTPFRAEWTEEIRMPG